MNKHIKDYTRTHTHTLKHISIRTRTHKHNKERLCLTLKHANIIKNFLHAQTNIIKNNIIKNTTQQTQHKHNKERLCLTLKHANIIKNFKTINHANILKENYLNTNIFLKVYYAFYRA